MLRRSIAETVSIPAAVVSPEAIAVRNAVLEDEPAADSAEYLFELLVAARRIAVTHRYRFLAYLIGMAVEEARLLTLGRSAARL